MARTGGAASWYSINPKVDIRISQKYLRISLP